MSTEKKTPKGMIITLSAREHLFNLAGVKQGLSEGLRTSSKALLDASGNLSKHFSAKKYQTKVLSESLAMMKNIAQQLETQAQNSQSESNQCLDRAMRCADSSSLRKRTKRAIIAMVEAFKEG